MQNRHHQARNIRSLDRAQFALGELLQAEGGLSLNS
jgi:hypothetical protein